MGRVGVSSGGTASGTTMSCVDGQLFGADLFVDGGTAIGTVVMGGGELAVSSGGTAVGTTVSSGGELALYGGTASGTNFVGGNESIGGGLVVSGVTVVGSDLASFFLILPARRSAIPLASAALSGSLPAAPPSVPS